MNASREGMHCQRCRSPVEEGETYDFFGQALCEDCYIYMVNPPRVCDPTAVAGAVTTRKQLGQSGTAGLTELQKHIYRTIEERGKITRDELLREVKVKPEELERQIAVLRHCELIRAFKEGDKVYLTKW